MKTIMDDLAVQFRFSDEILFTAGDFTAQLCCSTESQRIAYHLRYNSYINAGLIPENEQEVLTDPYDLQANSRTHLIWHKNIPVATVRTAVWSSSYEWALTEGLESFWHDIQRTIGLQNTIIESNRFTTAPELSGRNSLRAQIMLFRIQDLNAQYEDCRHIITAVRKKHVPFYQRMLGFHPISKEKYYPWLDEDVVLLGVSAEESRATISKKGMDAVTADEVNHYSKLANSLKSMV